ncbi:MAG: glutathione peroxidase [Motiliproteus sp.]|nr:glutathione peroxidase [Motiliproteus sp.]MCW9052108.1 glutathione peroxidase [Motiliproteus sp.]
MTSLPLSLKHISLLLTIPVSLIFATSAQAENCPLFSEQPIRKLHSDTLISACEQFQGKPLLIVNTASHCGYSDQFSSLESLHKQYQADGLVVLGFPSNDFRQEAKDEQETAQVCYLNYGVTFTMSAPVQVKGANAHPVFQYLTEQAGAPRWNFYKYVVSGDRQQVIRLPSAVTPGSDKMATAIRKVL